MSYELTLFHRKKFSITRETLTFATQTDGERTPDGCRILKISVMKTRKIHRLSQSEMDRMFNAFISDGLYKEYAEMLANDIVKRRSWADGITVAIDGERMGKDDPEDFPFSLDGSADIARLNDIIFDYAKSVSVGEAKPIAAKGIIHFSSNGNSDSQQVTFEGETSLMEQDIFEFGEAIAYCVKDALKEYQDYLTAVYLGEPAYMHEAFFAYLRMKGETPVQETERQNAIWRIRWNEFYNMCDHECERVLTNEDEALSFYGQKKAELDGKYADRGIYALDEVNCQSGKDYNAMSYNNGEETTYIEIVKEYKL